MREDYYAGLEDRYFMTFDQAKEKKLKIDFNAISPAPSPNKIGITLIDNVTLEDVVPYIDWVRHLEFNACFTQILLPITLCLYYILETESILPNMGASWTLSKPWLSENLQRRSCWH